MSSLLFSIVLNEVIKEGKRDVKGYEVIYWKMRKIEITELYYADDIVIIAKDETTLNKNMEIYRNTLKKMKMKISKESTKTMILGRNEQHHTIQINNELLEQVRTFKHLGAVISEDGKMDEEVNERKTVGGKIYNNIKHSFLGKKAIPKDIIVQVFEKVVTPILIHRDETWTLTEIQKRKLTATEMRFLRRIESKTRLDKIRNTTYTGTLKV